MKIFKDYSEAMKLVGNFPVVEGEVRTISIVVGFLGIMILIGSVCFFDLNPEKHFKLFMFLLIVFCTILTLPLYYPYH